MWVHRDQGEGLALERGPSIVDISTLALFMNSSICQDKPLCILLPWQPQTWNLINSTCYEINIDQTIAVKVLFFYYAVGSRAWGGMLLARDFPRQTSISVGAWAGWEAAPAHRLQGGGL